MGLKQRVRKLYREGEALHPELLTEEMLASNHSEEQRRKARRASRSRAKNRGANLTTPRSGRQ